MLGITEKDEEPEMIFSSNVESETEEFYGLPQLI
jgi:hypothetical protein